MLLNAAPFAISLLFLPLAAIGALHGGFWMLLAPVYAFLAIPSLDVVMKLNEAHLPSGTDATALVWHRAITWLWVPTQLILIYGLIWISANTNNLSWWEVLAMAVVVGIATGGIGITYAHELIHQKPLFERRLGELLMCSTLYGHWCIEHVYGHHINVATPDDPATAREGESVYQFLPRVLLHTVVGAWVLQKTMLERRGLSVWPYQNALWRYALATLTLLLLAAWLGGGVGIVIFVVQAVVAILLLELVDYLEHYGLLRQQRADGRFEPTRPHHSWNSAHQASNWLLINLQRHSDHHYKPQRRFPTLQSYPENEAPQLPFGYPWMVILALYPPLWFRMMDPRLKDWKARYYPDAVASS